MFRTSLLADAAMASLYPQKVAATLLGVVGVVCLVLAAVGLYSVMSYAVSQRTQKFGVRIALGAAPGAILGLVFRSAFTMVAPGLLAGLAAALALSRLVTGMLIQVSAADPVGFTAAACFLSAVALVASYLPALRATRLDPIRALRFE